MYMSGEVKHTVQVCKGGNRAYTVRYSSGWRSDCEKWSSGWGDGIRVERMMEWMRGVCVWCGTDGGVGSSVSGSESGLGGEMREVSGVWE